MSKYIYHNEQVRCRIKTVNDGFTAFELQIQEKMWLGWRNRGYSIDIKLEEGDEDSLLENGGWRLNPYCGSYQFGNSYERWLVQTFDLKKRVQEMFKEYDESVAYSGRIGNRAKVMIEKL